ncbi:MAG TPA: Crp/Fnr family transcriptional regulator [Dehalococcoidales bacterium]|nr:Crp/Fnr family transcriptional regulator [Dehalococcoidales bacterium]
MAITKTMLEKMHYFTGLNQAQLAVVEKSIAYEQNVPKGESLLADGAESEYMYFVVSGSVKVYKKSPHNKEQILNIATTGESLNDVSIFDGLGSAANMLAITPVRLYAIKQKEMLKLFLENPKIARNVARVLASRVRRDSSLVEVLSFSQVSSRLAKLILKQGQAAGNQMLPNFTQQDLAEMVGTSRVVVNRALRTLEEKGAIRLSRRRIIITNVTILADLTK